MILSVCEQSSFLSTILFIKSVIEIVSIIVPLILIISLAIELFKIVVGKTESINSHVKSIVGKTVAAVAVFFLPLLASLIISFVTGTKVQDGDCWNNANKDDIKTYKLAEEAQEKTEKLKREEEKKASEEERRKVEEAREKARQENERKAEEERKKKESGRTGKPIAVAPGMKRGTTSDGLKYWEYVPDNPTTNMGLIIFLHGAGEVGSLDSMITVSFPKNMNEGLYKGYNAVFLAPNTSSSWGPVDQQVMNLIEEKITQYSIDRKHIILTGHSLGGNGAWKMAGRHPGFFSALVPVSGCPNNYGAETYKNIPIRSYVGADEHGYRNCNVGFINQINNLGGNAEFFALPSPNNTHGSVVNIYKDPELINWMLSQ